MALIPLDMVSRQVRLNCRLLATQSLVSSGVGVLLWSLSPFVSDSPGWRYFALCGGMICGGAAVYSAAALGVTARLNTASEKAESDDYIYRIAASRFAQQSLWDTIATIATSQAVEVPVENGNAPESLEAPGKAGVTDFPSTSEFPVELVFPAVAEALEAGKSDSYVIQEILGMKGRRYADGKQMLTEIKEAIANAREGR